MYKCAVTFCSHPFHSKSSNFVIRSDHDRSISFLLLSISIAFHVPMFSDFFSTDIYSLLNFALNNAPPPLHSILSRTFFPLLFLLSHNDSKVEKPSSKNRRGFGNYFLKLKLNKSTMYMSRTTHNECKFSSVWI